MGLPEGQERGKGFATKDTKSTTVCVDTPVLNLSCPGRSDLASRSTKACLIFVFFVVRMILFSSLWTSLTRRSRDQGSTERCPLPWIPAFAEMRMVAESFHCEAAQQPWQSRCPGSSSLQGTVLQEPSSHASCSREGDFAHLVFFVVIIVEQKQSPGK
jgi:hypothetical protein